MDNEINAKQASNITKGSFYIANVMTSIFKKIRKQAEQGENRIDYTIIYPQDDGISKDALTQAVYLKLSDLEYDANFQDCSDIQGIQFSISWQKHLRK